jgi:endonuclease-3
MRKRFPQLRLHTGIEHRHAVLADPEFRFGQPLLPIDRHVDRVMRRVGVLPPKPTLEEAHDLVLGLFEPDQMYEAHVNLIQHGRKICHAQRPEHDACPLRLRCRNVDPKAP